MFCKFEELLSDTFDKEKKYLFVTSQLKDQKLGVLHQKFDDWLDKTWHHTKQDYQRSFSVEKRHVQQLPRHNVSSIYTAYTDLSCFDYTKTKHRYLLFKQKYIYSLNIYRYSSPFPVYVSILKFNGPTCDRHYPDSSCAVHSKLFFTNLIQYSYWLYRFSMFVSVPTIIFIIIYIGLKDEQYEDSYDDKQETIKSTQMNNFSPLQIPDENILKSFDDKIRNDLHLWFIRQEIQGYQNISELCRTTLNKTFLKQCVSRKTYFVQ